MYTLSMASAPFGALVVLLLQAGASPGSPSQAPTPVPLQKLIAEARSDLAKRLSVPADEVSLVRSRAVVWANASLGCPEPGMAYAEVLTPGYLIVLRARDREYEYHSGRTGSLTYCKNPEPPTRVEPNDT